MPFIPAPGRWKQEDHEFESSLIYIGRLCFNVLAFPMTIKALCKDSGWGIVIYSAQDLDAINLASLGS